MGLRGFQLDELETPPPLSASHRRQAPWSKPPQILAKTAGKLHFWGARPARAFTEGNFSARHRSPSRLCQSFAEWASQTKCSENSEDRTENSEKPTEKLGESRGKLGGVLTRLGGPPEKLGELPKKLGGVPEKLGGVLTKL